MNQIAQLTCIVALSFCNFVFAGDLSVAEIEQKITAKQSEYDNYNKNLESEIGAANVLEKELGELRKNVILADAERQAALVVMNTQYEKMVDNPELDISKSRDNYGNSVRNHKRIKDAITDKYNAWQSKLLDVDNMQVSKHSLLNKIEGLKEQLNGARIDRLYREFNRQEAVEVSNKIACDKDETISKCTERGKSLAKQKASKRFLDALYSGLSESAEAQARRQSSDVNVQVVRTEVLDSNFSGQGNFNVKMNLQLQGNLKRTEGCALLGLDRRYCLGNVSKETALVVERPQVIESDGSVMYELTVRSNVFDDEVFIDGVSYGSTKLQIMLPAGEHNIEIVKRGYEPYRQNIIVKEQITLKAELQRAKYAFSKGEKIQDMLESDIAGPELVVVPAGSFRMGDISGKGLSNERPVETKEIRHSFGMGETEITVKAFEQFVQSTNFVTEAEKDKGCASYSEGEALWERNRNWRSPGFPQTDKSPVVCVSLQDARAFVAWMSKASNQVYKLPTEEQWEYAARGGKETDFWWGEGVGTDNANCGWCGSQWSNVSSSPVGTFERNNFGLFDTVGNVWEWTSNSFDANSGVVRGGAWNFAPRLARVSTRMELEPNFRANYIGFRVVREQ